MTRDAAPALRIAAAFACRPQLIILDEPTTALDVITGARILDLFTELRAEAPVACLYISHDLALVARVAERVAVLDAGRIVEQGAAREVLRTPRTPQTRRLLDAIPDPAHRLIAPPRPPMPPPLLSMDGIGVTYGQAGRLARLLGTSVPSRGAADVSLAVNRGEVLGIVGESGSGKSTLAHVLCGLTPFTGGLTLERTRLSPSGRMGRAWHRDVQIIFQNPDASLNPRRRIGTILGRPLRPYGRASPGMVAADVSRMLEEVGLPPAYSARHPARIIRWREAARRHRPGLPPPRSW